MGRPRAALRALLGAAGVMVVEVEEERERGRRQTTTERATTRAEFPRPLFDEALSLARSAGLTRELVAALTTATASSVPSPPPHQPRPPSRRRGPWPSAPTRTRSSPGARPKTPRSRCSPQGTGTLQSLRTPPRARGSRLWRSPRASAAAAAARLRWRLPAASPCRSRGRAARSRSWPRTSQTPWPRRGGSPRQPRSR